MQIIETAYLHRKFFKKPRSTGPVRIKVTQANRSYDRHNESLSSQRAPPAGDPHEQ
jgi:hypothetical protein